MKCTNLLKMIELDGRVIIKQGDKIKVINRVGEAFDGRVESLER